jgi:hypothetical protein
LLTETVLLWLTGVKTLDAYYKVQLGTRPESETEEPLADDGQTQM